MNEKLRNLRVKCDVIGCIALGAYLFVVMAGNDNISYVIRVITATAASIAYAVKFGAELMSEERCYSSGLLCFVCILDIIINAIRMV